MDDRIVKINYFNNQGIGYLNQKMYKDAIFSFDKAMRVGSNALSSFYLGVSYQHLNELIEAIANYKEAIRINPKFTLAHLNIGVIFLGANDAEKAFPFLSTAMTLEPTNPLIYTNMGNYFIQIKDEEEAIEYYTKSIKIDPTIPQNYFNLACLYFGRKRLSEAEALFEKAIEVEPNYQDAYLHLGIVRKEAAKFYEARLMFEKYLEFNPQSIEAYTFLGSMELAIGEIDKAKKYFKRAIKINPKSAAAYNELGNALKYEGKFDDAINNYKEAIKAKPDFSDAHHNLAVTLNDFGKHSESITEGIKLLQESLKLNPEASDTLALLGIVLRGTGFVEKSIKVFQELDSFTKKELSEEIKTGETPFINVVRCEDLKSNLEVAKRWANSIKMSMQFVRDPFVFKKRSVSGKIRIGYLSADFHDHATAHLMMGVFREHNKDKFEIYAYSYGRDDASSYRKDIERFCDEFRNVNNLSHHKTAELINDDKIDILIDLKGYTTDSRMEILALRPAPIAATYLGFPGATGADFIDYLITDKTITSIDDSKYYAEKLVFLPNSYQATDNKQKIAKDNIDRKMLGLPDDKFVFCSFSQTYKIDPATINAWISILKKTEKSILWLFENNSLSKKNLTSYFVKNGIAPQRLFFGKSMPKEIHLKRLQSADLALDTFIYNGHTTTSDALWAGVPVIALQGKHFASRVSSSLLTAIGLPELITTTPKQYEELAIRIAKSPKLLKSLKTKLQQNKLTAPLFDTIKFARNLEKAYAIMFENYQKGKKPKEIEVEYKK